MVKEEAMFEYMLASDIAKLEMEQLDRKIERLRAGLVVSEGEKRLMTNLALVGSHVLVSLGGALVSIGERLSGGRASGWTATV
jgi:hypothetical protein